jgi:glycogen phosphorylase
MNGGLNLSVRDGWWDEWYDGGNGWEIPSADGVADVSRRDELEAQALYELLGKSVAPLFYERDADGIPQGWVDRIRHALRSLGPKVQAERMVREYVTELYVPAAASSRSLADADRFGPARELAAWKQRVIAAWPQVRIEHVESEAAGSVGQRLGSALAVHVSVALGELTRDDVAVEVVYGRPDEDDQIVRPAYVTLTADPAAPDPAGTGPAGTGPASSVSAGPGSVGPVSVAPASAGPASAGLAPAGAFAAAAGDAPGVVRYSGEVPLDRPGPFGYTVRVLPNHPLLDSRAELGLVTYPQAPSGMTNGDLR